MAKYGSRKFLLALLIVLLATGLCAFTLIDGGMWVTVVSLALTVYVGANVAQKATAKQTVEISNASVGDVVGQAWRQASGSTN